MIKFTPKRYSDTDEIVEGITGAGVLGGSAYGAYNLSSAGRTKKFIRARVKAENRARATRDQLSRAANKVRVTERLEGHPTFKKRMTKGKIGAGIALGSGLAYGLYEKSKNYSVIGTREIEAKLRGMGYSDREMQETTLALEQLNGKYKEQMESWVSGKITLDPLDLIDRWRTNND